jgi:methionine-rich copper-binding protein CopC
MGPGESPARDVVALIGCVPALPAPYQICRRQRGEPIIPTPPLRRSLAVLALGAALAAVPAVAVAHAELVSSDPEAGANLETAPSEVTITFDDELGPDGSGFTVTDHHGDEVGSGTLDLDIADRNVLAGAVSISEPGVYTVEWTVVGIDGHEISGSFSFGYATDEEIPDAEDGHSHENPDTALPAPPSAPLVILGLGLLALAALLAIRRVVLR